MADGSSNRVSREIKPLKVGIQQYYEELTLDVVRMASHNIVLGKPSLNRYNPTIDWSKGVLKIEATGVVTGRQPTHRQRTMVDEKGHQVVVEACEASSSKKGTGIQQR